MWEVAVLSRSVRAFNAGAERTEDIILYPATAKVELRKELFGERYKWV